MPLTYLCMHTDMHTRVRAHAKPAHSIPPWKPWDEAPGTSLDPICSVIIQRPIPCAEMEPALGTAALGNGGWQYQGLGAGRAPGQEGDRAPPQRCLPGPPPIAGASHGQPQAGAGSAA